MLAAVFAVLFGLSLLPGRKPLCLRFAERISGGIMPDGAERYCRRLTWIWFALLTALVVVNFGIVFELSPGELDPTRARPLAFAASGALSLAVVALTFAVERAVRNRRFRVVFHTSGSTGSSKTVVKTFEMLAKEVAMHRRRFVGRFGAEAMRDVVFVGTVQWDHMYGRLWMDMLPKALGAAADREVVRAPESLVAKMKAAKKVFLVTTPSFLDRFTAYAGQYEVPRNCLEVVTSGALLTREVSDRAERVFGVAPLQIFGSTETGGVAWRRFGESAAPFDWSVFGEVRVSRLSDGRLRVDSPFSFRRGYAMGDGVRLAPDGRSFELLGRMDRLVKVNEERVNLAEMEGKVKALGFADCALAKLSGRRGDFLGCLLVGEERPAVEMRRLLLGVFPEGTVPRRFRFVPELPRNAQGKVLAADVVRMLERVEMPLRFPIGESWFRGHFPGMPILPGVVQLGRAVEESRRRFGVTGALRRVKKMKFVNVIGPDEDVVLTLERKDDGSIAYGYRKGDEPCSSGVLEF